MQKFILPTADLVARFKDYEYFLVFYDEGIHGLIKDIVQRQYGYQHYQKELKDTNDLVLFIDNIMLKYDNSPEAIFSQYSENTRWNGILIILIESLDAIIKETLVSFFNKSNYQICKHSCEWVGNDLMISVIGQQHVNRTTGRFIK